MDALGDRPISLRHLGDLREHVALSLLLARGGLQLPRALAHRGAFLGRESLLLGGFPLSHATTLVSGGWRNWGAVGDFAETRRGSSWPLRTPRRARMARGSRADCRRPISPTWWPWSRAVTSEAKTPARCCAGCWSWTR